MKSLLVCICKRENKSFSKSLVVTSRSAFADQLKYFVFTGEEKCEWIEFDYTCNYNKLKA